LPDFQHANSGATGPELGGHCVPIDPFFLAWKAHECEFPTRFIELAGEINSSMPEHVVDSLPSYDYEAIVRNSRLVVDMWNATHQLTEHREKIVWCCKTGMQTICRLFSVTNGISPSTPKSCRLRIFARRRSVWFLAVAY
jgi:UDP-N-acetyl-D-glucosamine dehydrogenase